jgi:hypothetical protein
MKTKGNRMETKRTSRLQIALHHFVDVEAQLAS